MEKKKAKDIFDDAVSSGNTGVKVSYDEEVADILRFSIGTI